MQPKVPKNVAIVDAYSSGQFLAPEMTRQGFSCIHIQSAFQIPELYASSFHPEHFCKTLVYEGDFANLLQQVSNLNLTWVIAGSELGVELADRLSEKLNISGNGTKLSAARRNKFLMIETLRKSGLRAARQYCSDQTADIIHWAKELGKWPLVLKPLASAGTDSVFLCFSETEIKQACDAVIGKKNQLGIYNQQILAQEFLEGVEYIVDTVSLTGKHYVASIWRYNKISVNGAHFVYDTVELLPSTGEIQEKLGEYVFSVLNALEISNGPAHAEVMMTQDGPCLVEIGARLDGANMPLFQRVCQENGQMDLFLDSLIDPHRFLTKINAPYKIHKWGLEVDLIAKKEGKIRTLAHIDELKSLRSFYRMDLKVKVGDEIGKTIDMATCPGIIQLAHTDKSTLEADYKMIRSLEDSDLFGMMEDLS